MTAASHFAGLLTIYFDYSAGMLFSHGRGSGICCIVMRSSICIIYHKSIAVCRHHAGVSILTHNRKTILLPIEKNRQLKKPKHLQFFAVGWLAFLSQRKNSARLVHFAAMENTSSENTCRNGVDPYNVINQQKTSEQ